VKIGILTYHKEVNAGATVQTYCLYKLIASLFPYAQVEVIDYCPFWAFKKQLRNHFQFRKFPFFINKAFINKKKYLYNFLDKEIKLSKNFLISDNIEKTIAFIQEQNYDVIIVGSDTVWGVSAKNARFPNAYFLPGITSSTKVAFAVSADPVTQQTIKLFHKKENLLNIRKALESFSFISVRDEATFSLLEAIGVSGNDINFMPDPTFLYDFEKIVEDSFYSCRRHDKFTVGLQIGEDRLIFKKLQKMLRKEKINFIDFFSFDKQYSSFSLEEHLGAYRKIDLMITDRFHGSIFTLKIRKCPVIFLESPQKWPLQNSKGRSLFRLMGLEHMVYRYKYEDFSFNLLEKYKNGWDLSEAEVKKRLDGIKEKFQKEIVKFMATINKEEVEATNLRK